MRRARRAGRRAAGLAAALATALTLTRAAAADLERRVMYYDVGGRTAAELRAALNQVGPLDATGTRWDGYTAWHLRWRLVVGDHGGGGCALERVETQLRVDVTLPRWQAPVDAERGLERRWRRYVAALEAHEAGHEKIARDAAAAVGKAAGRRREAPDCVTLEGEANAAAQAALARAHRAEADYDRRTRHGARQGARFP